jgi:4'-phosphopantetheinyl transferase
VVERIDVRVASFAEVTPAVCGVSGTPSAEVWVWRVDLDRAPAWVQPMTALLLTPSELARRGRCRPHLQHRRVAARAALRVIASSCVERPFEEVRLALGPHGKPELPAGGSEESWHFSLTRSGCSALIAATKIGPVGIDVERLAWFPYLEEIAVRRFATEEVAAILREPGPRRLAAFLRCWTGKEAYLKAAGLGLAVPIDRVCVTGDDPPVLLRAPDADPAEWTLAALDLDDDLIGALAVRGATKPLAVREAMMRWPAQPPGFGAAPGSDR